MLNRIVRWTDDGLEYEADPRHVEIILKQLNIGHCKAVAAPGTKEEGRAKLGDEVEAIGAHLPVHERTRSRRQTGPPEHP